MCFSCRATQHCPLVLRLSVANQKPGVPMRAGWTLTPALCPSRLAGLGRAVYPCRHTPVRTVRPAPAQPSNCSDPLTPRVQRQARPYGPVRPSLHQPQLQATLKDKCAAEWILILKSCVAGSMLAQALEASQHAQVLVEASLRKFSGGTRLFLTFVNQCVWVICRASP